MPNIEFVLSHLKLLPICIFIVRANTIKNLYTLSAMVFYAQLKRILKVLLKQTKKMTNSKKPHSPARIKSAAKGRSKSSESAKEKKMNMCNDETDEGCNAITFVEQCRILKEIEDERYRNFFYFCCCTGVRVCEALSIKVKDIDKKNTLIKIKMCDSKTKKHKRSIPYLPELFENMPLKGEFLFNDITDEGSKQYFYKLYKKLGLELTRHSTRHTFVSICSHIGINPACIQQWAGHTDLKMTTNTYTHALQKGTSPILMYLRKLKKHAKTTPAKCDKTSSPKTADKPKKQANLNQKTTSTTRKK